jgi:hypothetical protein
VRAMPHLSPQPHCGCSTRASRQRRGKRQWSGAMLYIGCVNAVYSLHIALLAAYRWALWGTESVGDSVGEGATVNTWRRLSKKPG